MKVCALLTFVCFLPAVVFGEKSKSSPCYCPPGFYKNEITNDCEKCGYKEFMSEYNLAHKCGDCTMPSELGNSITKSPCTIYNDTVLGCMDGYYEIRRHDNTKTLEQCKKCRPPCKSPKSYEAQPCSGTRNRVCCANETMLLDKYGKCYVPNLSTESPPTSTTEETKASHEKSAKPAAEKEQNSKNHKPTENNHCHCNWEQDSIGNIGSNMFYIMFIFIVFVACLQAIFFMYKLYKHCCNSRPVNSPEWVPMVPR